MHRPGIRRPTSGKIAASAPKQFCAQDIAPHAWRATATLPPEFVPHDLSFLCINAILAANDVEFRREVISLARSMSRIHVPKEGLVNTLQALGDRLEDSSLRECGFFYLACVGDETAFKECTGGEMRHRNLFLEVKQNALRDPSAAQRVLHFVLTACIRYDLHTRYLVCRNDLLRDMPAFTIPSQYRDWVLVFLGHYNREWVKKFMSELHISNNKTRRAAHLVRSDVGIFCSALIRTKANSSSESYVQKFGGEGRKAFAFLYRNPPLVWQAMSWPCSPREQQRMQRLAEEGVGLSVDEAVDICLAALI